MKVKCKLRTSIVKKYQPELEFLASKNQEKMTPALDMYFNIVFNSARKFC